MKHVQGRRMLRARPIRVVTTGAVILVLAALTVAATRHDKPSDPTAQPVPGTLPHTPGTYLGVYTAQVPVSYAGVTSFTTTTGVRPNVITYYSGWYEPFQTRFATTAAKQGAVTLVQIEPTHVSLAAIASGKYDGYLSAYAAAVRSYRHPVILSFGHEMNGSWYTWGHRHASPAEFVAAWRHIVSLFRALGAGNVTWLWTINIIDKQKDAIPDPAPWWPGSSYVTWVGIDGYFINPSSVFASVFGPTIVYVRALTHDPILISETSATPVTSQPAKIADLFAGIHLYELLGFVWFDSSGEVDWRLSTPAAIAAFRQGASSLNRTNS